jgi:hypothetical protein
MDYLTVSRILFVLFLLNEAVVMVRLEHDYLASLNFTHRGFDSFLWN